MRGRFLNDLSPLFPAFADHLKVLLKTSIVIIEQSLPPEKFKMPREDWFIIMVMGGFFILFGLVAYFWGRAEDKSYYNSLSTRTDVREYLEHRPQRPGLGALKLGGWIAIALGLSMLAMGGALLLWG